MFSKENLDNFISLSDDEIRQRLANAAKAGNISPERLRGVLADTEKLRRFMSQMRPEDVERFIKIIGKENAEKMAEKLKESL